MKINVLAGDSLVKQIKEINIDGELIICRECLIDGDVYAESLNEFWYLRNNYLSLNSEKEVNFYQNKVQSEFETLLKIAVGNELNLWFEYEVFCQTNLWFCIYLLKDIDCKINLVYPYLKDKSDIWNGFGYLDKDGLKKSLDQKIVLNQQDIKFGARLWELYSKREFTKLKEISLTKTNVFPTLNEVSIAISEINSRPKKTIQKILNTGETEFSRVFQEFNKIEKIYGFGDLQVKRIFDETKILMNN